MRPTIVIGFLGSPLHAAKFGAARWNKWRPTVSLCMQEDLRIDRFELIPGSGHAGLGRYIAADVAGVAPETEVNLREMDFADPWDFEEVYGKLLDFARAYEFDTDAEDYLVHITTGTHVAQICLFLLTEGRYLPARLLQSSPPSGKGGGAQGSWSAIDLDLSRYD